MKDGKSPELFETQGIERERSQMLKTVSRLSREAFIGILPQGDLEQRLEEILKIQFLSEKEFGLLAQQNSMYLDADGVIMYEVNGQDVRRYAVVKQTDSRADTLHTLAHEVTHLMAPESHRVTDPTREGEDEQVFSVYSGPLRYERFVHNGKVDPMSVIFDRPKQRALFWEAVTDWHADEMLIDTLTDEEKKKVETGGYFERHYIAFLVDHASDREEIIRAIRRAYATGDESPFIFALEKLTGRQDNHLYEELLDVLKLDPNDWQTRIEKWIETVKRYFPDQVFA